MVPCCFETFGLNAAFEGIFPFKHVGRHVAQDSQIFRTMVFAYTAVVFSERYIQAPVQAVFDTPVCSDGIGDVGGLVFEAGDEKGGFGRGLAINFPFPDSHADGVNTRPLVFFRKPADIVGGEIPPGFDAAMLPINGFESVEGAIGRLLEEQSDVLTELPLIVFDLDDIIGLRVDNRLGNFFLAPHGVNRDNGSPQGQGLYQFRDGSDLIGLVSGLELAQHQADIRSPGTDQVYRGAAVGSVVGAAQGFSIDGDCFTLEGFGKLPHPAGEEVMEPLGIELGEETAEGVMGGDAVGQFQEFLKPVKLGAAVFSYLGPGVGAADEGAKSNQEDIVEQVPGVVPSGVLDAVEMFAEGCIGRRPASVTS